MALSFISKKIGSNACILIFMKLKNSMLKWIKHEKSFIAMGPVCSYWSKCFIVVWCVLWLTDLASPFEYGSYYILIYPFMLIRSNTICYNANREDAGKTMQMHWLIWAAGYQCFKSLPASCEFCRPFCVDDFNSLRFGPRSGPTQCRSWSGSKPFDTLIVFLKEFFLKI